MLEIAYLHKKHGLEYKLVGYKTAAARSLRINRHTMEKYFKAYIPTVNMSTPISSVWSTTNKISGRSNSPFYITLRYGNELSDTISNPAIAAYVLDYAFSNNSSSSLLS